MLRYILIAVLFICSCFQAWGQEHQWYEPFFANVNLGGDSRADMKVDKQGNTYLMVLFEDEVTILDTTLYTSKDNGVFVAKFDENHNLIWAKVIAEAKEENPNQSRVMDNLYIEIDKENQMLYPVVEYTDSTYLNSQLHTVIQTETYHRDIAIFKMDLHGVIQDIYSINGSCQTVFGSVQIEDDFVYFHVKNNRSNLDSDSVCSCQINSDTTLYFEKNNAILGRMKMSTEQVDWIKVYKAGHRPISVGKMDFIDSSLYVSGYVFGNSDLVIDNDSMVVPNTYLKYGYVMRFNTNGTQKWSKYYAVKGWDSQAIPRDLKVNSNNDIVLVANLWTQSVANQVFFENAPTLNGFGTTSNDESFFVVNYDSLGNVKWHDISNNLGYERMSSIDFDSDKNMYLAGTFSSNEFTFGSQYIEGYGFSNDILIISYDSVGNKRWAQIAGGNGSDIGAYMSIDSSDNLHVAGYITGVSATFGAYEAIPPGSGYSIFVAQMKLEPIGLEETTPQQFGVSLYPNPSLGNTHIEIQDEFISQIRVYNALGQEVQTLNFKNQTSKASIENLVSGYYIIDIHSLSGKRVSQKLIVQ